MRTAMATIIVLSLAVGCASSPQPSDGPRTTGQRNVITRDEIIDVNQETAYEVIQSLRAQWLRPVARGATTGMAYPTVYVESQYWGEIEDLKRMSADAVAELRYLNARDATTRGWNRNNAGVIQIIRRYGPGDQGGEA